MTHYVMGCFSTLIPQLLQTLYFKADVMNLVILFCAKTCHTMFFATDDFRKYIDDAKRGGYSVRLRHLKILFAGASKVGKSTFVQLLKGKKVNLEYHTTEVATTEKVVIPNKIDVSGRKWLELDETEEIRQLRSRLQLQLLKKREDVPIHEHRFPLSQSSFSTFSSSAYSEHSYSEHSELGVEACLYSTDPVNSTPGEQVSPTWNVLTLMDSGGQPEFINLLPAINKLSKVTFIVLNMCNNLNELVTVHHSNKEYETRKTQYTHLHLIKCLLSVLKDAAVSKDTLLAGLQFNKEKSASCFESELCILGTHLDQAKVESINEIEKSIQDLIKEMNLSKHLKVWTHDGKILFKVNALNEADCLVPVQEIRSNIHDSLEKEVDEILVPLPWVLLELEIRTMCKQQNRCYLLFDEVLMVSDKMMARSKKMDKKEIETALKFHHNHGMLLYFHKVKSMRKYVIADPNWLFITLAKLMCCRLKSKVLRNYDLVEQFNTTGILSEILIKEISVDEANDIPHKSFLDLLEHLRIIATLKKKAAYFMPFTLPAIKCNERTILQQYGKTSTGNTDVHPLLVQFEVGTLPRGVFCCLVVQLLKDNSSWEPLNNKEEIFDSLITFLTDSNQYVTLLDRILYLEIQLRHPSNPSFHYQIRSKITQALVKVCKKLDLKNSTLCYGFWCSECEYGSKHMTKLMNSAQDDCSRCVFKKLTMMNESHKIWFEDKLKVNDKFYVV